MKKTDRGDERRMVAQVSAAKRVWARPIRPSREERKGETWIEMEEVE